MEFIEENNKVGEEANAFARSGTVQRSPVTSVAGTSGSHRQLESVPERFFTPVLGSDSTQLERRKSSVAEIRRKVNELYEFVKDKNNVHLKIKQMVTSLKAVTLAAEREQEALTLRAETAEKALVEAAGRTQATVEATPKSHRDTRSEKRTRDSPGEQGDPKKQKNEQDCGSQEGGSKGREWRTVESKQSKRNKRKQKEEKQVQKKEKKEQKQKERRRPPREKYRGDALIIEANDKTTYAALLKKVRADPELKELGENVVKTRRTQKGEMMFELKKDPSVKSTAFKELIAKSLGDEASVRAISQEATVECKNLDEITSADDLRRALAEECNLECQMTIRIRKAYRGTQTAAIRLPVEAANKLVAMGKVRVGWSDCSLRLVPRVTKQMEKCFKCMGFGHQSRDCKGPDRSELCWKCSGSGHFARDCTKQPSCMLCKPEDGNDHWTGGSKCPVYQKAKAGQ